MLLSKTYHLARSVFLAWIILQGLSSCTRTGSFQLKPGFTIYINDTNSVPIARTLEILQRDIKQTLGQESKVITGPCSGQDLSNSLVIINGECPDLGIEELPGFERHKLYALKKKLVIHGSDTRGTIYAIHSFSEKFLGIDPLWHWTGNWPTSINTIRIARGYSYDSGEPYVKYRCWLPQDAGTSSLWRKQSNQHKEFWLETMLRLKMNSVELHTSGDYPEMDAVGADTKLIQEYGLKITNHHNSAPNTPTTKMIFYDDLSRLKEAGLLPPHEGEELMCNLVEVPGGPWDMEYRYRHLDSLSASPIFFSVADAGKLQQNLLTLSANAEMLWNFQSYDTDRFLRSFCLTYYGEEHAECISGLYERFYKAYWRQTSHEPDGCEGQYIFHDLKYKQTINWLSEAFFDPVDPLLAGECIWGKDLYLTRNNVAEDTGGESNQEVLLRGTVESCRSFKKVAQEADSLLPLLAQEKQLFFNDNLLSVSYFMMYLNETLHYYCQAYLSHDDIHREENLRIALNAAMNARESIFETAHDQFQTWYAEEGVFDMDDLVSRIDKTLKLHLHQKGHL